MTSTLLVDALGVIVTVIPPTSAYDDDVVLDFVVVFAETTLI
jgi:hypothetical protein